MASVIPFTYAGAQPVGSLLARLGLLESVESADETVMETSSNACSPSSSRPRRARWARSRPSWPRCCAAPGRMRASSTTSAYRCLPPAWWI